MLVSRMSSAHPSVQASSLVCGGPSPPVERGMVPLVLGGAIGTLVQAKIARQQLHLLRPLRCAGSACPGLHVVKVVEDVLGFMVTFELSPKRLAVGSVRSVHGRR